MLTTKQLEQGIAPYREFMAKVPDTQFAEGLAKMIEEEAEKARLHSKQDRSKAAWEADVAF